MQKTPAGSLLQVRSTMDSVGCPFAAVQDAINTVAPGNRNIAFGFRVVASPIGSSANQLW
jgi:hypothetical protein